MPRIGTKKTLQVLWVLAAGCLTCAGCMAGRDFSGSSGGLSMMSRQQAMADNGASLTDTVQPAPTHADSMNGPPTDGAGVVSLLGPPVPRELEKVTHPTYVIEPPDILLIDAVRL